MRYPSTENAKKQHQNNCVLVIKIQKIFSVFLNFPVFYVFSMKFMKNLRFRCCQKIVIIPQIIFSS